MGFINVLLTYLLTERHVTGETQSPLPVIVPSGGLSSPSVPEGTGGTKSKVRLTYPGGGYCNGYSLLALAAG